MKNLSRWSWFAIAFLTLNAAGWLLVANRRSAAPAPEGGNIPAVNPEAPAATPAPESAKPENPPPSPPELNSVQQVSFSTDRRLGLKLNFSRPVRRLLLKDHFKILTEDKRRAIPWELGNYDNKKEVEANIIINTLEPLPTDRVFLSLDVPKDAGDQETVWDQQF